MMGKRPRIADVQCTRLQFQPGDRVIVRVYHRIDKVDEKKIKRMVEKWAGDLVEVIVIDCTQMELDIEHRQTFTG